MNFIHRVRIFLPLRGAITSLKARPMCSINSTPPPLPKMRNGQVNACDLTKRLKPKSLTLKIALYLFKEINIRTTDGNSSTPLHLAAKKDSVEAVKLLCVHRADVEAQQTNGWTPLHVAARYGSREMIEVRS